LYQLRLAAQFDKEAGEMSVLLQNRKMAAEFFRGTNQSGSVLIEGN